MTKPSSPSLPQDLSGCELLVGVCGGIAAYKTCEVVSALAQRGAVVTVAMTRAARKFVGPATFQALSGRRVLTNLWHSDEVEQIQHIALSGSADLMLVAPATANMIGKLASGIADDVLSTLAVSAACPVVLAPAMNNRMWENPIVQRNVGTLREAGYKFVGPAEGWLACRSEGPGRMAEPAEILDALVSMLTAKLPRKVARQRDVAALDASRKGQAP